MRANFIGRGASAHTKYCSSKARAGRWPAEAAEAMFEVMFEVSERHKRTKSKNERQEATMIDQMLFVLIQVMN